MERFVSVDPGVTTGVVVLDLYKWWRSDDLYSMLAAMKARVEQEDLSGRVHLPLRQMEVNGPESGQIDEIYRLISGQDKGGITASAVIIEDFILRLGTKDRQLLAPVRLAARLEDRLYSSGFGGEIVYQTPSDAKSIVTDERLKHWGLWHVGSPHIRDAWRHMIKYLRDNRG